MKAAYPVVLTKGESHIVAYVPDFRINTEGSDLADALEMARDAIGITGVDIEDAGEPIPAPSAVEEVAAAYPQATVTQVEVDFAAYRRKNGLPPT